MVALTEAVQSEDVALETFLKYTEAPDPVASRCKGLRRGGAILPQDHRRERERRVDAGDETAKLKFSRPAVSVGVPVPASAALRKASAAANTASGCSLTRAVAHNRMCRVHPGQGRWQGLGQRRRQRQACLHRTLRQRIRERQSLVRTCCRQIWSCARTMNTQLIVSRYTACNVKKRWFVSCCLRPVPRKASLPTVGATSWILKIPHGMRTLQNKSFQAKQARTTYDARGSSWSSSSGGVTREECSES